MENTKQRIGEIIGEASMCWSQTPVGIFDSTRASGLIEEVMTHIQYPIQEESASSLSDSTLREILGEVGEDMQREGIKVGTGLIKGSEIESGVVIGTNQERRRIRAIISKRLEK